MVINTFDYKEFQKYFRNTSWLMGEKAMRAIANLFVGTYVARYLGPADYGLLSYAISFVMIFSSIAGLGLDQILIRDLHNKGNKDVLLGTAFFLKLFGALIAWGLIVILLLSQHDRLNNLLIIIIAGGLFFQSFNVIDFYFQSKVESKYIVIAQIIQIVFSCILKLYCIFIGASLVWFAIILFLENFILALFSLLMFKFRKNHFSKWQFDKKIAVDLLKDSFPLILSGVALSIYMRLDQIMIKNMLDANALGYYSAAVTICESTYVIPAVIASSLFPAILEAKQKSERLYYELLQRLYDFMMWCAVIVIIPIFFLGDKIMFLLFGKAFEGGVVTLQIYICATVFVFVGIASAKWYVVERLQKYSMYRTFMGAFINIFLNLFLIPYFGINGAAISTVIAYAVATYFSMGFLKNLKPNFRLISRSFNIIAGFKRIYNAFN